MNILRTRIILVILSLFMVLIAQLAYGGGITLTETPISGPISTPSAWENIDNFLKSSLTGDLTFDTPASMILDETKAIQL